MKRIRITRDAGGNVSFETVAVDRTENVFFINLDPLDEHQPDLISNKLGPAPSPPSSKAQPDPTGTKTQVVYKCLIAGHGSESGVINIFPVLAKDVTNLAPATKGQPIAQQRVVKGGKSPYQISNQVFQIVDAAGNILQNGTGIGPGLQLAPTPDNKGIFVQGTPTASGIYQFTFEVNDDMGGNLQQDQYSMTVT